MNLILKNSRAISTFIPLNWAANLALKIIKTSKDKRASKRPAWQACIGTRSKMRFVSPRITQGKGRHPSHDLNYKLAINLTKT